MNYRIPKLAESETRQPALPCWDEDAVSEADVRRFVHRKSLLKLNEFCYPRH